MILELNELLSKENLLQRGVTQNELSNMTGLSNTYINYIRNNKIKNPSRSKIIAIGAGLNYTYDDINLLLLKNEFKEIYKEDFIDFIDIAKKRKIIGLQVVHENIDYMMMLLSIDNIQGDKFLVEKRPSSTLESPEYVLFQDKLFNNTANSTFRELKVNILLERKKILNNLLEKNKIEYLICHKCFLDYIAKINNSEKESFFIKEHLSELLTYLDHKNYNLNFLQQCPGIRFTLKFHNDEETNLKNIVMLYGYASHFFDTQQKQVGSKKERVLGIASDSTKLFEHLTLEFNDLYQKHAMKEFKAKTDLKDYLYKIIKS